MVTVNRSGLAGNPDVSDDVIMDWIEQTVTNLGGAGTPAADAFLLAASNGVWEITAAADLNDGTKTAEFSVDNRDPCPPRAACNCWSCPNWWLIKSGSCQIHP